MAEAVIVSIVEKVVAYLVPQAIEKVGKLRGVDAELKELGDTVSMLLPVLDHAEEQYHQKSYIRVWVENLKDALYEAQDVLEEFNIEAMQRELRGPNEMIKEIITFFSPSNQLAFKLSMSKKVRKVRETIQNLKDVKNFHLDERPVDSQAERERRNGDETHSFMHEKDIIGRDDDKTKIKKFLLDSDVKEDISILPIVGIGGLGKTALVQFVYNDEMVSKNFHLKMWVYVSNDFNVKKIVTNIITCAKNEAPGKVAMEQLQSELRRAIEGKRYLLVLDDLWNDDPEKWLKLKQLLVGGARGSKILITTRLPSVAKITGTTLPYSLKDLSENASIDLLMQMACRKKEELQDPEMLAIAKEIAKKCSGVPLVVRIVGHLLSSKETKFEWLRFKDDKLPQVYQSEDSTKSVLELSYNHLPSHLKQCFAFCSLFPKDYKIKKQTLVDLWMAEGFIQQSNGSQHLEDIAHGYFMDLLLSNFFQDFEKDPNTNEETCKMHDLMHDLACLVAGTECWVAWDDRKSIPKRTRHISYGSTFNLMGELPISRIQASALRTFLCAASDRQMEPTSKANLCQLIQSFKRLRVLDLHTTYVEKVPKSICKLKHLTYLDLSHNEALKRLPKSITRLQNLQTLNLSGCSSLKELPRGIRKLVSLRNLDIDCCPKLRYVPRGLGQLSSLRRLTRFILPKDKALAKDCCGLGELKELNNIRGSLRIENLGGTTDAVAESRAANLIGKHSLESLELIWGNFDIDDAVIGNTDEVLLDELRPHSNLQKLTIEGYNGESFPRWMMDSLVSSLPNLVEVCFFNCARCKSLPPLGQLPHLKTLEIWKLIELEYIQSNHSSTSTISFPSLLKLKIYGCEKLKAVPPTPHLKELMLSNANPVLIYIIVGLNKLKSLDIQYMEFLGCVPEECWKSLTSLEFLCIQYCPGLTSLSKTPPPLGTQHQSNLVDLDSSDSEKLNLSNYDESSGNNNHLILNSRGGFQNLRILSNHSSTSTISFPSLLKLYIGSCEKLEAVPPTPHLEDLTLTRAHPALINMIYGLNKLKSLVIKEIESLECVPEECWKSLTSLESLFIYQCPRLTSLSKAPPPLGTRHQSNLVDLDSSISEELDLSNHDESSGGNNNHLILELHRLYSVNLSFLPKLASLPKWLLQLSNLERLSIACCDELDLCKDESGKNNLILDSHGGLRNLRSMDLYELPKLASLPQWLLQLSNLEDLCIQYCEELDLCKDESGNLILDFHGGLHQSLRSLRIRGLPKLASLPQWLLQASNLEDLTIVSCSNLKELPGQIEALQSLQQLAIYFCPSLTSLPEGMQRLASLTHLRIAYCSKLKERCNRDGGEDWYKIAHIPHIDFET